MAWIGEVEGTKRLEVPETAASTTGKSLPHLEVLDSKVDCGLRSFLQGSFKRPVSTAECEAQKHRIFSTGCQIAWVIYRSFRICGESYAILDFGELIMVELKDDNVRSFDTKWNEVLSSMSTPSRPDLEQFFHVAAREVT